MSSFETWFNDVIAKYGPLGISGPLIATVLAVVGGLWFYANYIDDDTKPKGPQRDPNLPLPSPIVSLRIYPIKSCRGFEVEGTKLKKTGLDLDRHWMFVDAATKEFLTIRSDPTMTLIDTSLSEVEDKYELKISIHGTEDAVTVNAYPTTEWLEANCTLERVQIWETITDGWQYGDSINDVFSKYFKKPVKLIYKGPEPRISRGSAGPELYGEEVSTMFADVMSIQIASESSLADLNKRLEDNPDAPAAPLTIERFRPNIVIAGNAAWEEDGWKRVQIVDVNHAKQELRRYELDVVCRCARCLVPNVDPDTAEKNAREPWNTLMKFRRVDTGGPAKFKPCFGMLCLPRKEGVIRVGNMLEVLEVTDKHLYNTAKFEDL